MPLFNDCEMFSHNEEIYYSFFKLKTCKKLLYITNIIVYK